MQPMQPMHAARHLQASTAPPPCCESGAALLRFHLTSPHLTSPRLTSPHLPTPHPLRYFSSRLHTNAEYMSLGLEHEDKGPRRPQHYNRYIEHKAIKIYS
jgi:hypothetical protein